MDEKNNVRKLGAANHVKTNHGSLRILSRQNASTSLLTVHCDKEVDLSSKDSFLVLGANSFSGASFVKFCLTEKSTL